MQLASILLRAFAAIFTTDIGLQLFFFFFPKLVVSLVLILGNADLIESVSFFLNFIYFWLCWVFVAAHRFSLVVASRGYSSLWCVGFSMWWLLLLWSMGSRHMGFSSCSTWAQQLRHVGSRTCGLVAPRHVGSSQTRARTRVPCIGRQILNHCATREAPGRWILNHCATREVPESVLIISLFFTLWKYLWRIDVNFA